MLNRRSFIKKMAACGATALIPQIITGKGGLAFATNNSNINQNILVRVFLSGGADSSSILVPKNVQSYFDLRGSLAIQNSLAIDSSHGVHPNFPFLQQRYLEGKAAIIQKIGFPNLDRSHRDSSRYWETGDETGASELGWLGRLVDHYYQDSDFGVVSLTGYRNDLAANIGNNLVASSLSSVKHINDYSIYSSDSELRRAIISENFIENAGINEQNLMLGDAWSRMMNSVDLVKDVTLIYSSSTVYPNSSLGRQFQDAAKIINPASALKPKVIIIEQGGYDVHADLINSMQSLISDLNASLEAFWQDIDQLGGLGNITILIESEFGREIIANGGGGTDHGWGSNVILIGNTVKGGLHGSNYSSSDFTSGRYFVPNIDPREVRQEILEKFLDVDSSIIQPHQFSKTGLDLFWS